MDLDYLIGKTISAVLVSRGGDNTEEATLTLVDGSQVVLNFDPEGGNFYLSLVALPGRDYKFLVSYSKSRDLLYVYDNEGHSVFTLFRADLPSRIEHMSRKELSDWLLSYHSNTLKTHNLV